MNHLQEQEEINRRIAHRKAHDKRHRPVAYRCKCGQLVAKSTASMEEQQAGKCAECYRAANAEGLP